MKTRLFSRLFYPILTILVVSFSYSTHALAAFFPVTVDQVVAVDNEDVIIQVLPGQGETRFNAADCPCRVVIANTASGKKNMLAVVLTAFALNREITVQISNPPSSVSQVLQRVSVNAP